MSDPVEWLTEKLAKIEALASGAESLAKSPWRADGGRIEHSGGNVDRDREKFLWDSESCTEDWQPLCMRHGVAQFVAAFDPAMVLRLVAATRAVLELHKPNPMDDHMRDWYLRFHPEQAGGWCLTCGERPGGPGDCALLEVLSPCPTLRAVAAGWGWTDE